MTCGFYVRKIWSQIYLYLLGNNTSHMYSVYAQLVYNAFQAPVLPRTPITTIGKFIIIILFLFFACWVFLSHTCAGLYDGPRPVDFGLRLIPSFHFHSLPAVQLHCCTLLFSLGLSLAFQSMNGGLQPDSLKP